MTERYRVGELRPSQILLAFGIGSVVDLPGLSVMIMGLNDWDITRSREIGEPRLLAAVQRHLGPQVERLVAPPAPPDSGLAPGPFDESLLVGVPVATFPRWVVCPACRLLAQLGSGLFELRADPVRPDRTRYVHRNCNRSPRPPAVNPARFLVACERGHLDDFPWAWFVHRDAPPCPAALRFSELGASGEAAELQVMCDGCGRQRRMVEAFGGEDDPKLPACRGRRPHLRDHEENCTGPVRAILLGASNSWFPVVLSALSVPSASGRLERLVDSHWPVLGKAQNRDMITFARDAGMLTAFGGTWTDDQIWEAVETRRAGAGATQESDDLRGPEWALLSAPDPACNTEDFRLRQVPTPQRFANHFSKVVLGERLREVRALIGFTRIESPGEFGDDDTVAPDRRAPLARRPPTWLPANEVRGEGIFLQLEEDAVQRWLNGRRRREQEAEFREAHRGWRRMRGREPLDAGFPGLRYVLLHSLSHVLMRRLAVECGYTAASIRERIYAREPGGPGGPMAGVMLYTAAADSEGTLGGLISLGEPQALGRLLGSALDDARLCASDPLCAEHHPWRDGHSLDAAACHACMFAAETSCERGNRYLDRAVLGETIETGDLAFFGSLG